MAAWIRNHLGYTHPTAAKMLRTGRRLRDLPVTTAAWLAGSLADGQIEILVANVTERRAALFADHEAALIPGLGNLDLQSTKIALQTWAQRADAVLDADEPPLDPAAEAQLVQTLDGRAYLRGPSTPKATSSSPPDCGSPTPTTATSAPPNAAAKPCSMSSGTTSTTKT